jgi:NTE family protein
VSTTRPAINLALQGGGAHGAFTWGVLDRLLEDGRLAVEGISGTSAGAMNAAVLAYGLARGGADGAREALADFWDRVAVAAAFSPIKPSPLDRWLSIGNMDFSPSWIAFDNLTRMFSPYEFNPLNLNPLREVLCEVVDFDWLGEQCARDVVKLFLCATNVKTCKIHVFKGREVSAEAVLASACLPFLFHAVEIDGAAYWDGGYMGNPPIFPLIYDTQCSDVLLVQINPVNIDEVPKRAHDIVDRVNEVGFNSSLMRELRTIAFVTRLIDEGRLDMERYKRLNMHAIEAEDELAKLTVSSKLNADRDFLKWLFALGRRRAEAWLERDVDKVGRESSLDLQKFL